MRKSLPKVPRVKWAKITRCSVEGTSKKRYTVTCYTCGRVSTKTIHCREEFKVPPECQHDKGSTFKEVGLIEVFKGVLRAKHKSMVVNYIYAGASEKRLVKFEEFFKAIVIMADRHLDSYRLDPRTVRLTSPEMGLRVSNIEFDRAAEASILWPTVTELKKEAGVNNERGN